MRDWRLKKMEDGHYYDRKCTRTNPGWFLYTVFSLASIALILMIVLFAGGCATTRNECSGGSCPVPVEALDASERSLIFRGTGDWYDPRMTVEYSRNDKYLGVVDWDKEHKRIMDHQKRQTIIIKSTDRQRTNNGSISDRFEFITETRTESK